MKELTLRLLWTLLLWPLVCSQLWCLECFLKEDGSVYFLPHPGLWQAYGLESMCVLWCLARSLELLNAFPQPGVWHMYGLSPVCDLKWIFKFSNREKALLHPGYWKVSVFQLVHYFLVISSSFREQKKSWKKLTLHLLGFSPEWTLIWINNLYRALNGFPCLGQLSQKQMNSSFNPVPLIRVWVVVWLLRWSTCVFWMWLTCWNKWYQWESENKEWVSREGDWVASCKRERERENQELTSWSWEGKLAWHPNQRHELISFNSSSNNRSGELNEPSSEIHSSMMFWKLAVASSFVLSVWSWFNDRPKSWKGSSDICGSWWSGVVGFNSSWNEGKRFIIPGSE